MKLWYAVSGKGQGRIFTSCPTREKRLGVWVGETSGPITLTAMILGGEGLRLPKLTWDDEPIELELSITVT